MPSTPIKSCNKYVLSYKDSSNIIWMIQNWIMTDPILYLSMLLGLGGVYVLISSFHDDDDGDDDGDKYIYNLEHTDLARQLMCL